MLRILVFQFNRRLSMCLRTSFLEKVWNFADHFLPNRKNHLQNIWSMNVLEMLKQFSICFLIVTVFKDKISLKMKDEKLMTIIWRYMLYLDTVIKRINITPFNLKTKNVTNFYEIAVSFSPKISLIS